LLKEVKKDVDDDDEEKDLMKSTVKTTQNKFTKCKH